jgi:hypothetical protein
MSQVIDVQGLPDEQVKLIEEFVRFLRVHAKKPLTEPSREGEISFSEWPLGVKGKITRDEIYDYL